MKTRSAISFGPLTAALSVLLLGSTVIVTASIADATAREQSRAEKKGHEEAAAAQAALAKGNPDAAIRHAEAAVAFEPQMAGYRMTLGQSYLKAGHFTSARDAFADVLALDDGNGKAALDYALAQIATGDWAGARKTLDAHAATIPVSDRGLAIALAGDPAAAVDLLGTAARTPAADAKVRQNYALSLALAGRWREAQTVVAMDVAPAAVAKRILDWSTFSRPKSASDQVATLLGVTSVMDAGRPAALALNATPHADGPTMAAAAPIDTLMPKAPEQTAPAPMAVAAESPTAPVGPSIAGVVFGERREVVQPIPVSLAAASTKQSADHVAAPKVMMASHTVARGKFVVQLGAYDNAGVAHDAWGRAARRYAGFAGHTPQGMSITTAGRSFYRLSVGGFARGDAVAMCERYRASGGACFVRAGAGDQVAMWAKGSELASR